MSEFVDPATHVHRNYQQRPIIRPVSADEKQGKHTCKVCGEKIDGITYTRTTRFVGALEDRYGLERWQERGVATGLSKRPDLLLAASNNANDDNRLDEICESAKEAAGLNVKRELGTELHTLTERIDRGEDPPIPPTFAADIQAYRAATEKFETLDVELFVVLDQYRVGGTLDRLVKLNGQCFIADVKTGKLDYSGPKIAMQLATYARSQRYDPTTGERSPLHVNTSRGVIFHLPPGEGTCTIRWADLDRGWRGVEIASSTWDFRREAGMLDASEPGNVPALDELIKFCADRESIEAIWHDWAHVWTDDLTAIARERLVELESASA